MTSYERGAHVSSVDPEGRTATDRAQYLAFSKTWFNAIRLSETNRRDFETQVIDYFHGLCRKLAPSVVLEVGAHGAGFSRWAAEALPSARVVAFEANPHVHEKFAPVLEATRVEYRHAAVGPVTGEIELNLPREVRGRKRPVTSRMASLGMHTEASDTEQVQVPCVRLDDFFTLGEADRAVAWIDVEGANASVLQSGPDLLGRLDAVYIEVEREVTWEGQWLDTDVARHLHDHGLVPVARDVAQRNHQYNVVYVRGRLLEDPWVPRRTARLLADLVRA
jgi:FkbM family methyltransferase